MRDEVAQLHGEARAHLRQTRGAVLGGGLRVVGGEVRVLGGEVRVLGEWLRVLGG